MNRFLITGRAFMYAITLLLLISVTNLWADEDSTVSRILVTGQGSTDIAADMAVLTLTVTRDEETARAALDANSADMSDVLSAMKSEGVKERDLQTSGFSIQPRYFYPPNKPSTNQQPPRIVGYTVRNSLTVRIRDISALGEILDTSVTLGVNEGGNILFTNDDPSSAITQARVKAVKDAMAKAKTLAEAAGVKVGKLLEMSEQTHNPRPMSMARAERSMAMSADSVPVATGENTYKVTVNMSFAIDQ